MKLPRLRRQWPAPLPCPTCGRTEGVRVVHGLPTEKAVQAAEAGEIVLGGCVMSDGDVRQCTACGHRWTASA